MVKNSYEFVDLIFTIKLMEQGTLTSFNVESLYSSMPIPEALKVLCDWLHSCDISDQKAELLHQAASLCISQNYSYYENEYFQQTV